MGEQRSKPTYFRGTREQVPHDHLNMTIAVDLDVKPQTKQTNIANFFPRSQALTALFMRKIKLDNAILYSQCHLYGKQCAP